MRTSSATRPPPLPALTGVRFIAALHVVLFHYGSEALSRTPGPIRAINAAGPSAVCFFYVLSGTVLAYSCTKEDGALAGTQESFWRSRFARIYPIYLTALLLDAPFFVSGLLKSHRPVEALVRACLLAPPVLLLVHAWLPLTVFAWNIPGWSISDEAFFYTVFPRVEARLRCGSLTQLVRRGAVLYGLVLIPPILSTVAELSRAPLLQVRVPSGPDGIDLQSWIVRFCGFSPIARVPEFLLGVCLGHWLRARLAGGTHDSSSRSAVLETIAVLLTTAGLIAGGSIAHSKPWLDSGVFAPVFALLIAVLATGSGPLARLFSTRVFQVLGDASYALYILQEPAVIHVTRALLLTALPQGLYVPVFVVVLIGASVLCQRTIGEPARAWLLGRRPS